MQIVVARPPMFDEINAKFHVVGKPVFFCWGPAIYNPSGVKISAALVAHEGVHCRRQGADIEGWWRRYIDDPAFRLAEEIPAHIEEYRVMCEQGGRHERRAGLSNIARRLASPLYGNLITFAAAKKAIAA